MQITKLSVTDYKRIRGAVVEFAADASGVVEVGGRNEQGKSSFLDALEVAIAGPRKVPAARPVRLGADEAHIVAEFTEPDGSKIVVTRRFRPDGSTTIEVRVDGVKVTRTATILDRLWSHVAFDPFAWGSLPSKDQVDTLVRLSGIDPKPFDVEFDQAFEQRRDVNREVDRLAKVLASSTDDPAALELGEQDSAAILAELDKLARRNDDRMRADESVDAYSRQLRSLDEQIAQLTERRQQVHESRVEATKLVVTLGDIEPEDELRQRLNAVSEVNARVHTQQARVATQQQHDELAKRAAALTAKLNDTVERKRQAFADADLPVEGITIEDGEVYLQGTPFSQTSPGGKLKTGTAIAIALNPELRAIIIRDGSLLDHQNRKIVDDIAREHGFLVLMEVVDENVESGIVFEDGELVIP